MTAYKKTEYNLIGFRKSTRKGKMYDAILTNKKTGKKVHIPFGSAQYQNYGDKTGLNLYPHLIHNDEKRRKLYRKRHKGFLKPGYYSPAFFSFNFLWK